MKVKLAFLITAATLGLMALVFMVGTAARQKLPEPTGSFGVGRTRLSWVDDERPERFHPERNREIIAEVWYPAEPHTGRPCAYFPELDAIANESVQGGRLTGLEVWGLGQIRCHGRADATFAATTAACPVVLLSPGNATNVEFYATYAEDLASRGVVVFGVNHPYDVTAVRLHDGTVALYVEHTSGDLEAVNVRIDERVADARFLIDRLQDLNEGDGPLAKHLDLKRIGIMGHSLGGITASAACAVDSRLAACINIDGLRAGNPYSVRPQDKTPPQPFTYVGKDRTISSETRRLVEDNPRGALVVIPGAQHMDFADSNMFVPTLNPFQRRAYWAITEARRAAGDFFEKWLR
jgi:dienelactone hydrolase